MRTNRSKRPARAHGTGSVTSYATKGGPRWRFQLSAPIDPARPELGLRNHSRGGFTSYDEANSALTLLQADLIRGLPQTIGRDTFHAYGQRWLDGHAVGNGTRMYIQRVLDAMDPYIGTVRLADIRATDLAAAYRGLERGTHQQPSRKRRQPGLATSTVARYANWVNTIFLAAQDEGLIVKNPANSKHSGAAPDVFRSVVAWLAGSSGVAGDLEPVRAGRWPRGHRQELHRRAARGVAPPVSIERDAHRHGGT